MPLNSMLLRVSEIATGNETVSPSDVLVASLDLCGTTIYRSNRSPRSPLTNALFLAII